MTHERSRFDGDSKGREVAVAGMMDICDAGSEPEESLEEG